MVSVENVNDDKSNGTYLPQVFKMKVIFDPGLPVLGVIFYLVMLPIAITIV